MILEYPSMVEEQSSCLTDRNIHHEAEQIMRYTILWYAYFTRVSQLKVNKVPSFLNKIWVDHDMLSDSFQLFLLEDELVAWSRCLISANSRALFCTSSSRPRTRRKILSQSSTHKGFPLAVKSRSCSLSWDWCWSSNVIWDLKKKRRKKTILGNSISLKGLSRREKN